MYTACRQLLCLTGRADTCQALGVRVGWGRALLLSPLAGMQACTCTQHTLCLCHMLRMPCLAAGTHLSQQHTHRAWRHAGCVRPVTHSGAAAWRTTQQAPCASAIWAQSEEQVGCALCAHATTANTSTHGSCWCHIRHHKVHARPGEHDDSLLWPHSRSASHARLQPVHQ